MTFEDDPTEAELKDAVFIDESDFWDKLKQLTKGKE